MNIERKVEKLNSKASLRRLDKKFKEKYVYLSFLYYLRLSDLNALLNCEELDFYYNVLDTFEGISYALNAFENHLNKNLEENRKCLEENFLNINSLTPKNYEKLIEHLNKENIIFKKYHKKIKNFNNILYSSIVFVQKRMIELNLVYSTDTDYNYISTFAKSVRILKNKMEILNTKIDDELDFLFESLKYIPKENNTFVILTKKELEKLKYYNEKLNYPVNFPVWDGATNKDIIFNDGKGEGVFNEFTPIY